MAEKDVIAFKGDDELDQGKLESVSVTLEKNDGNEVRITQKIEEAEKPKTEEPKSFTWQGVKFPAYFKGPHFIQIKGSIVLAIDPDCVSMEMRTNWQNIYVPELAALGKKIIEKHLKIKIEKLD